MCVCVGVGGWVGVWVGVGVGARANWGRGAGAHVLASYGTCRLPYDLHVPWHPDEWGVCVRALEAGCRPVRRVPRGGRHGLQCSVVIGGCVLVVLKSTKKT